MSKLNERRRSNAKAYLESQLVKGTKPEKVNKKTTNKMIPLTEGDKTRIKKDIEILSHPKGKKTTT
jgi:hypothetical protein